MAAVRNLIIRGGADFSALNKSFDNLAGKVKQTSRVVSRGLDFSFVNRSLHKAIALLPIAAIGAAGHKMVDLASDLEEVQNVVDTAFGSFKKMAEAYSKLAGNFGLSEFQIKKTSSQYMAMAKSLGIAEGQAAKMSLATASLTGDISSFFNVSQDESSTAVKSLFTGESEPLKAYGVIMTEAALAEYALSKGINKTYKEMSSAEKVTLRYAYVMEQLSYVQGDATKTSGSWANQVRKTTENLKTVLSTFGSGLIDIFVNVFPLINKLIERLQYVAYVFKFLTSQIFGVTEEAQTAPNVFQGAIDGADELKEGIEEVSTANKKAIAGFDKLNILADPSKGKTAGGGGSSGDGSVGSDIQSLADSTDGYYKQYMEEQAAANESIMNKAKERADELLKKLQPVQEAYEKLKGMLAAKLGLNIDCSALDIAKTAFGRFTEYIKTHGETIKKVLLGIAIVLGVIAAIRAFNTMVTGIEVAVGAVTAFFLTTKGSIKLIGSFCSGLLKGLVSPIKTFGSTITTKLFHPSKTGLEMMADGLNVIQHPIGPIKAGLVKIGGAIKGLVSPITLVIAIIAVCVAAVIYAYQKCGDARDFIQGALDSIKEAFSALGDFLWQIVDDVIVPIMDQFSCCVEPVKNAFVVFGTAISLILDAVAKVIGWFVKAVIKILTPVVRVFGVICGAVAGIFAGFIELIAGFISGDWSAVWDGFVKIVTSALSAFMLVLVAIGNACIWGFRRIIDGWNEFYAMLPDKAKDFLADKLGIGELQYMGYIDTSYDNLEDLTTYALAPAIGLSEQEKQETLDRIKDRQTVQDAKAWIDQYGDQAHFHRGGYEKGNNKRREQLGQDAVNRESYDYYQGLIDEQEKEKKEHRKQVFGFGDKKKEQKKDEKPIELEGAGDGEHLFDGIQIGSTGIGDPLADLQTTLNNAMSDKPSSDFGQYIDAGVVPPVNSDLIPGTTGTGTTPVSGFQAVIAKEDMTEAVKDGNIPVVNALWEVCTQLKTVIQNKALTIDGKQMADNTTYHQNEKSKITGKPVFAY